MAKKRKTAKSHWENAVWKNEKNTSDFVQYFLCCNIIVYILCVVSVFNLKISIFCFEWTDKEIVSLISYAKATAFYAFINNSEKGNSVWFFFNIKYSLVLSFYFSFPRSLSLSFFRFPSKCYQKDTFFQRRFTFHSRSPTRINTINMYCTLCITQKHFI